MKLLNRIEIRDIKSNPKADLDNLKDFNVIIGPNNCGKTNILKTILSVCDTGEGGKLLCQQCDKIRSHGGIHTRNLRFDKADIYLGGKDTQRKPYLRISFNENVASQIYKESFNSFHQINMDAVQNPDVHLSGDLTFTGTPPHLKQEHLSPFNFNNGFDKLSSSILYCPEARLQTYKDKLIKDYIREKKLRGAQLRAWAQFFNKIVDPKVEDYTQDLDIIRTLEDSYEAKLEDQGSGFRSVACLAIDILSSNDAYILLIDEPELGLNPLSKQLLLQFLLKESKKRQVIIATHDPTFVNPILWQSTDVSIYIYSQYNNEYVKVDLDQSNSDPITFGGYLPHTVSLCDTHIYVEGSSDVYIFQSFLRKYCQSKYKNNWSEMINRVGIFHLAGDFWRHLLYTLPNQPYKCIVILDGDKAKKAKEVCQAYSKSGENIVKIEFAENINEIQTIINEGHSHPVYCLSKDCIELYLGFNECKPPNYNNIIDGPKIAEGISVPEEINEIFDAVLSGPRH